jgi:hypothetical protein
MIELPEPSEESKWIESLYDADDCLVIESARGALEEGRLRLAGRVAGLLEPDILAAHEDLVRARGAAKFQVIAGGFSSELFSVEDEATLRRRRRQRRTRSKSRSRRNVNPKDPRFRRR